MNHTITFKNITETDLGHVQDFTGCSVTVEQVLNEEFTLFQHCYIEAFLGRVNDRYCLVSSPLANHYQDTLIQQGFSNAFLYGGITKTGRLFLFPMQIQPPDEDFNKLMVVLESALENQWIRVIDQSNFEFTSCAIDEDTPCETDLTPLEMLNLAFQGDQFINDLNHPVFITSTGETSENVVVTVV